MMLELTGDRLRPPVPPNPGRANHGNLRLTTRTLASPAIGHQLTVKPRPDRPGQLTCRGRGVGVDEGGDGRIAAQPVRTTVAKWPDTTDRRSYPDRPSWLSRDDLPGGVQVVPSRA